MQKSLIFLCVITLEAQLTTHEYLYTYISIPVSCIRYLRVHISDTLTWCNNTHHLQKGTRMPLFPGEAEEGGFQHRHPQLLQVHCGEYINFLHHCVVLQLQSCREAYAVEGGKFCTKDHQMQPTSPVRNLHQLLQGQSNLQQEQLLP